MGQRWIVDADREGVKKGSRLEADRLTERRRGIEADLTQIELAWDQLQ